MGAGDGEVRKAFEEAAGSVEQGLSQDASNALRQLYRDSKDKLQKISRDVKAGDEQSADKLKSIFSDMKENAGREGSAVDKGEAQTGLFKKFQSILDPVSDGGAESKVYSDVLKPPEGRDDVPWVGGSKTDGVKLGQLSDDSVTRDGDLITHVKVGGQDVPVDDYMDGLAKERLKMYQDAGKAGTFTKNDTGAAMAVGVDRRTGAVYEGINGDSSQVIPDAHQTLADRVQDMADTKGDDGYTWRDGSNGHDTKGDDAPLGHAEVKAADGMLKERDTLGVDSGDGAISEMSFAPLFPWVKKGVPDARTCPNCSHLLDGASLPYGMRPSY